METVFRDEKGNDARGLAGYMQDPAQPSRSLFQISSLR